MNINYLFPLIKSIKIYSLLSLKENFIQRNIMLNYNIVINIDISY